MTRAWEDFAVGQVIDSAALTVTEAHVVGFASLTGDWVPLHTDAAYASTTDFGERIAHGPLTMCLALGLMTQTRVFDGCIVAWLGFDEVRATFPVFLGDTIRSRMTATTVRRTKRPDRGLCTLEYEVLKQTDEVVMSFVSSLLLRTRAGKENSLDLPLAKDAET